MATIDKIAKQVAKGLKSAGMTKPATLIKKTPGTRTAGQVSGGTNPTSTNYTCRGLVITWKRVMLNATQVQASDRVVMLLGATLSVVPAIGDLVTCEGVTSRIVDIERDAASATYNLLTRS